MTGQRMEINDSLKKLISEIFCLADFLSAEILIGVRLDSWTKKTWASNGTEMKKELLSCGLIFDDDDIFYNETEMKDVNILDCDDDEETHLKEEKFYPDDGMKVKQENQSDRNGKDTFRQEKTRFDLQVATPSLALCSNSQGIECKGFVERL
jgi:hypothetical protein